MELLKMELKYTGVKLSKMQYANQSLLKKIY